MKLLCYSDNVKDLLTLVAMANQLDKKPYAALIGDEESAMDIISYNVEKVYYCNIKPYNPELYFNFICKVFESVNPSLIFMPNDVKSKTVAGMLATYKNYKCITDVINIGLSNNAINVKKLVYGGMAIATLKVEKPFIACISPTIALEAKKGVGGGLEQISIGMKTRINVEFTPSERTEMDPTMSDFVVAAGRGIKNKDDLNMIIELAGMVGGAWGVTRPLAADYGWASSWIGMTGITIKPKIYLALGISGQPYHMIGVKGANIIIAINSDENAPIFEEVDLGIIGDLYKILPKLLEKLKGGK